MTPTARDGSSAAYRTGETVALYDPLIGELIDGRYRVGVRLGEGMISTVYVATHQVIERRVALKVLKSSLVKDPIIVERFLQEARAASRLSHPGIVTISDFGKTPEGAPFLVMEFVDGQTMAARLAEVGRLSVDRAVAIATEIGHALAAAHQKGIVHRDLKPENVMLVPGDEGGEHVKLLDFGLAKVIQSNRKLTRAGEVLGTPDYMSPEQAMGRGVDGRADLYALGVLLYRMITGMVPFTGDSPMAIIGRLLSEDPKPPSALVDAPVPPGLDAVLLKAMARDAEDRFPSVDAMLQALRPFGGPATAPAVISPTSVSPKAVDEERSVAAVLDRSARARARRRLYLLLSLAGLLAVIAGVVLAVVLMSEEARDRDEASARDTGHLPKSRPLRLRSRSAPGIPTDGAPRRFRLSLRSTPSGATVYLEGRRAGMTPLVLNLPASPRTLGVVFVKSGFRKESRAIQLTQNVEIEVGLAALSQEKVESSPRLGPGGMTEPPPRPSDLKDPFSAMTIR